MRLLYPGSFDPLTIGHLDIVKRSMVLCDDLVIAVMNAGDKRAVFTCEERMELWRLALSEIPQAANIRIVNSAGLLVDLFQKVQATAVVRGIRNSSDYLYESEMAVINQKLCPWFEAIYLQAKPEFFHVSSSLIREMARLGHSFAQWVPHACLEAVESGFAAKALASNSVM